MHKRTSKFGAVGMTATVARPTVTVTSLGRAPVTVTSLGRAPVTVTSLGRVPISPAAVTASRNTVAAINASQSMSSAPKTLITTVPSLGKVPTSVNVPFVGNVPISAAAHAASQSMGMGPMKSYVPPGSTSMPGMPGAGTPTDSPPNYQAPQDTYQPPTDDQGVTWTNSDSQSSNGVASWQQDSSAMQSSQALTSLAMPSSFTTALAVAPNAASAPAQTVAPTLWQRILAFFGFGPKIPATPSKINGDPTNQSDAVASLVRRARNGDQNAMATIAEVRKQSKRGNKIAAASESMFHAYIKANPPGATPVFGADSDPNPVYTEAVRLSHGPLLSNLRIENLLSVLREDEQEAFLRGMKGIVDVRAHLAKANSAGRVIGQARKLQAVRMDISPIAKFDKGIAWELGEY